MKSWLDELGARFATQTSKKRKSRSNKCFYLVCNSMHFLIFNQMKIVELISWLKRSIFRCPSYFWHFSMLVTSSPASALNCTPDWNENTHFQETCIRRGHPLWHTYLFHNRINKFEFRCRTLSKYIPDRLLSSLYSRLN